jgi:hypothetical protein
MRVSVQDVILHNRIHSDVDTKFISEHLKIATADIDRKLGDKFDITTTEYPTLYEEAIKKQTYIFILPELNTFYKSDFPNMEAEQSQFYLSPKQVNDKILNLSNRINEILEYLKVEIDTQSDKICPQTTGFWGAAGGNTRYIKSITNCGADNDDKK